MSLLHRALAQRTGASAPPGLSYRPPGSLLESRSGSILARAEERAVLNGDPAACLRSEYMHFRIHRTRRCP